MAHQLSLSEAEVDVLKVLWDLGPATVRAVNGELAGRGRKWAYTTVATLLARMASKGCVASDSAVVPHVYRATVSRDEMLTRRLTAAADELCNGDAVPLVLALVQPHRFKPADLVRFQKLLDAAKQAEARGDQPDDRPGSR